MGGRGSEVIVKGRDGAVAINPSDVSGKYILHNHNDNKDGTSGGIFLRATARRAK